MDMILNNEMNPIIKRKNSNKEILNDTFSLRNTIITSSTVLFGYKRIATISPCEDIDLEQCSFHENIIKKNEFMYNTNHILKNKTIQLMNKYKPNMEPNDIELNNVLKSEEKRIEFNTKIPKIIISNIERKPSIINNISISSRSDSDNINNRKLSSSIHESYSQLSSYRSHSARLEENNHSFNLLTLTPRTQTDIVQNGGEFIIHCRKGKKYEARILRKNNSPIYLGRYSNQKIAEEVCKKYVDTLLLLQEKQKIITLKKVDTYHLNDNISSIVEK